eukprot:TRINITY_DN5638_c0_g1_i3.p1 TRINITY_DN5638_c0_g1~~TRINITY_DN5638_c0_g1_i3.p1  ORF type:complete len:134 (+),score=15.66 TRINITY_DN5638_c0_g1_i3:114-515(+)
MIILMLPLAVSLNAGHLLGHGAFFSSGLPGGLDYLMLVLVKLGFMESIQEKKINSIIQSWIRAPGCLFHSLFTWSYMMQFEQNHTFLKYDWMVYVAGGVVASTFFWNAMYFQRRVVANYAIKEQEIKQSKVKQ